MTLSQFKHSCFCVDKSILGSSVYHGLPDTCYLNYQGLLIHLSIVFVFFIQRVAAWQ